MKRFNTLFVAPIYNLRISEALGEGFELPNGIKLTNDKDVIRSLVSEKHFRRAIGEIEHTAINRQAGVIAYSVVECYKESFDHDDHVSQELYNLTIFLFKLWQVKEHAAEVQSGFLEFPFFIRSSKVLKPHILSTYHSNELTNSTYILSNGAKDVVTFSADELERSMELHKDTKNASYDDSLFSEEMKDSVSRMSLATYYMSLAIGLSDLGLRIAQYCSALESLFASGTTELKHKLSERVALFIGANKADKDAIYACVSKAYNIRSRVVHGEFPSNSAIKELVEISQGCDEILRRVFNKLFESEELDELFRVKQTEAIKKKFEEFFYNLLFPEETDNKE